MKSIPGAAVRAFCSEVCGINHGSAADAGTVKTRVYFSCGCTWALKLARVHAPPSCVTALHPPWETSAVWASQVAILDPLPLQAMVVFRGCRPTSMLPRWPGPTRGSTLAQQGRRQAGAPEGLHCTSDHSDTPVSTWVPQVLRGSDLMRTPQGCFLKRRRAF